MKTAIEKNYNNLDNKYFGGKNMKQIRKLATLALIAVVSLLIMKLSGIRYSKSFEEIVNIGKTCIDYLSTWDGLTAGKIVIRIVVILVGVALVALPLIGLIRSLTKLKEKPVRGPLDFINCFALSFLVVELGYFCRPLLTVSHLTYAVWGVLAVCAILYQVCCLREIKGAEVVVEKQIEKEAVSLEGKTLHVVAGNDEYDAVVVRYEDPVITVETEEKNEPIVEPVEEPTEENEEDDLSEEPSDDASESAEESAESEEVAEEAASNPEKKYNKTYQERLGEAGDDLKKNYSILKNQLLKHRKVHARTSKSCETFRVGYDIVAKIVVAGKGLKLYLAKDPYSVDSAIYHQRDASSKKRFVDVPFVVKVKSPLSVRKACQLIDLVCEEKDIKFKTRYEEVDYSQVGVEQ